MINFKKLTTTGFDADALSTTVAGEKVFNFGALTTSGDLANGVFGGADNLTIYNFARITTRGAGAAGIFVLGNDARIDNFGSVVTHGGLFDPDPGVNGDEFVSDAITVFGDRFNIANHGTVHVEGDFASGMSGIGANGTIVNYGRVESSAFASVVMAAFGDGSHVINTGEVTGSADEIAAVLVFGEGATALNFGKVVASGVGSAGVGAAGADAQITNRGLVQLTGDEGAGMAAFGSGHQVNNFGHIAAQGDLTFGIASAGLDLQLVNTGMISTDGDVAVGIALGVNRFGFRPTQDGSIENKGVVHTHGDGSAGVILGGNGSHLVNSGDIAANGGGFASPVLGNVSAAGVLVSGDDAVVVNTLQGTIKSGNAGSAAVELNVVVRSGLSNADTSSRLDNAGLIKGAGIAVLGGDGQETVVNHGRIVGDVVLGDGADTFVFGMHGTLAGKLFLGGGDDLVRVEQDAGSMRIADFAAGSASGDVIDVSAYFSSFGQVTAHSHQAGSDVVIDLGHDRLVLEHVQLATLDDADFLLV
ncbi:hypothetical protein XI09_12540 [Bradyrhizobium sp. CCBAU 11386]|uniref:hypothetical protein n=1 Tax=Bradyrhizobium sp. CCBAU 11386 TaxID=1630837 RepID=UPI002302F0ED|nr:hypothetical protein [Bradyrhizobium sp. CCBAU 11386]MDA9505483.1 hypothetical protein [Bradyrhizobium sp. CCBAU 11386]